MSHSSKPPGAGPVRCSQCGTENPRGQAMCWLCGAVLVSAADDENYYASPAGGELPSYGLSTLLMVVTLIALILGVAAVAPGWAILLAVLAVPALVRTATASRGRATSAGEKVGLFLVSLGAAFTTLVTAVVTACAAFVAICFGGAFGATALRNVGGPRVLFNTIIPLAIGGGLLAGLVAAFVIARQLWPRREDK